MANAYATSRTARADEIPPSAEQQYNAYAAPPLSDGDAYIDQFGWAPKLRVSTVETPSAQRLQLIPRMEYRPDPEKPPDEWWDRQDKDREYRYSVEDQDANGWYTPAGVLPSDRRWQPNPRSTPPPETRPTERLGPRSYSFTRYFDQLNRTHAGDPLTGSARTFNGIHFSMADHRRTYEIMGMAPPMSRRNTYRVEPIPWDLDIIDLPPEGYSEPSARIRSVEVPTTSRSYRLG